MAEIVYWGIEDWQDVGYWMRLRIERLGVDDPDGVAFRSEESANNFVKKLLLAEAEELQTGKHEARFPSRGRPNSGDEWRYTPFGELNFSEEDGTWSILVPAQARTVTKLPRARMEIVVDGQVFYSDPGPEIVFGEWEDAGEVRLRGYSIRKVTLTVLGEP
ncbi:hypothetical protein UFOVP1382_77 [uncultured Caudovirales phage]|uniref:Uncharacterized protein n=1 Tax=uncultured Caudovirales phage TaxID=2100421 RepID=A0A6J5RXI8_9CAUD|nr:hypothetical protein UFOVP1382_77 [uncultured Caudovirales phage]